MTLPLDLRPTAKSGIPSLSVLQLPSHFRRATQPIQNVLDRMLRDCQLWGVDNLWYTAIVTDGEARWVTIGEAMGLYGAGPASGAKTDHRIAA